MKKSVLLLAAFCALIAQAEQVRLGTVFVNGRDKLGEAAFKLGMMSGNMMIGGFLQSALAEAPKKATAYAFLFDTETVKADLGPAEDCDKLPKFARGELVKLSICPKAFADLCAKEPFAAKIPEKSKRFINDLSELTGTFKLDDSGITVWMDVAVKPDSPLVAEEKPPLPVDMFAFAGKSALFAGIARDDAQGGGCSVIRKVCDILKSHGFKLDCVTVEGEGEDAFVTIDPKLIKSTIEANAELCASLDADEQKCEALKKDIEALKDEYEAKKSLGGSATIAINGYECAYTPQERFAATLPELSGKRVFSASVFSYYSFFKALAPHFEATRTSAALLPGESKGAIAFATYDDKATPEKGSCVVRVSADEIKSLGMASGIIIAAAMNPQVDEDLDDDDED